MADLCEECGYQLDRAPLFVDSDGKVCKCDACGRNTQWLPPEETAIFYASNVDEADDPEAHAAWRSNDGGTWRRWLDAWLARRLWLELDDEWRLAKNSQIRLEPDAQGAVPRPPAV